MFVDCGIDAPMESIAREAGVGIGTLYRRFPSRQALLLAVLARETATMADEARIALAEEPTRWAALARFTRSMVRQRVSLALFDADHGLRAIDDELARVTLTLWRLLDDIVAGAREEGMLRPDVTPMNLVGIIGMLTRHSAGRAGAAPAASSEQLTDIVLAGLQPRLRPDR
ncbi:TetR/AcrR family transcriptional regulator [Kutzneria kofuensis]